MQVVRLRKLKVRCKSQSRSLPSGVRLLDAIAVVLGLLFSMSDCIQPTAQQMEIDAAVTAPVPVERVRRLERSAAAEQPPAAESDRRHPNQRWQAYAQVERPAGGKNKARKLDKLGPFRGPTKEVAEAARNEAIDNATFTSQRRRGRRSRLAAARQRRRRRRRSLHQHARSETPHPARPARSRCPPSTLALNPASAAPAPGTPRLTRGAAQTRPAGKHTHHSRVQKRMLMIPRPSPAHCIQARPRQDARRCPP